ncbi:MAG: MarR family winged helix-turn-helix transcriptional regulator [Thermoanaerobaculia bacterium]
MARSMTLDIDTARAGIIADLRASLGELKCIGSERLVRQGISMSQLHVLNLLDSHGELAMSRLAEMLDVSLSAATGLVDRIEERGYVERIRVPSDRRVVLARITVVGQQLLHDVDSVQRETIERILDRLEETKLRRLALAVADLRSAVDAAGEDHAKGDYHTHQPHLHQPQGRN